MDFITHLPPRLGFDTILVMVDRLSKGARFIATNAEMSSEGTAKLYRDNVWREVGFPDTIISDRGRQFASKFTNDLYRQLGIVGNVSTAYHPQTDGQTERVNQELEQYLRLFTNYYQNDWADLLAIAEFSYNNTVHAAGNSPFFLNRGYHPNSGLQVWREGRNKAATTFVQRMKTSSEEAQAIWRRAADDMKRHYDAKRQDAPTYEKGQKVYLEATHLISERP
jgi:hypothetical protein